MKKKSINFGILVMLLSSFFIFSAEKTSAKSIINQGEKSIFEVKNKTGLTDKEKELLIFMREEEKLAHDVYVAMYEKWNLRIFDNISRSENIHTNSVKTLLDDYNIEDPFLSEAGKFQNKELQKLYDELVSKGNKSIEDALEVGAIIEEVDILDLQEALEVVENEDVKMVFENLLRGSRNHLRAFNRQLGFRKIDYKPQYLSQANFDEIVNGEHERGNRRGKGRGNGNCRNR